MVRSTHIIILYAILSISLFGNLYLLFNQERDQEVSIVPDPDISELPSLKLEQKPKGSRESLLSVFILPHPPEFFEGRRIYFKDYSIEESDNKRFILFNEKLNDQWVTTRVDSEAVKWK